MLNIFIQIISWLSFIILLTVLVMLFIWVWSTSRASTPFIPVSSKILKDIEKAFTLNDNSVVYDLGCGDGRVLFYLSDKYPQARYVGVENGTFPLILAKLRNWWRRIVHKSTIEIINGDFFETDLSSATHIFSYLYPNIMDDLLTKFDKELKNGTMLVSMSFHFTVKKEISMIDLHRKRYQLAKRIYVYEF